MWVVTGALALSALTACGPSETELQQEKLEADYEAAMNDLYNPTPPADYRPDPALVQGACGNAELMELACEKYGTTCDVAKLARKQCDQFQGL